MSIRDVFNAFDNDKNGSLDQKEFAALVRAFSSTADDAKIEENFKKMDADNSGTISFEEFEPMAKEKLTQIPDLKWLAQYRALDTDGNGVLSKDEVSQLASQVGNPVSQEKIDAADANGDGSLNYAEFVELMK